MRVDAEGVVIDRIGAGGDGIVRGSDPPRYIPFALPGECVRPSDLGLPHVVSDTSSSRIAPTCRHFGICGGCVAQHMAPKLYAQWKSSRLADALRHRAIESKIDDLQAVPAGSRRRAVLTARRQGSEIILGYHRRQSHDLFQIEECPVLHESIVSRLPALRAIAAAIGVAEARLTILASDTGCDVAVEAEERAQSLTPAKLARLATEHRLARLTFNGETVIEAASPVLKFAGVAVVPPPGAFVQATAEAQEVLTRRVLEAVAGCKRVADLFCGIGTFTFALAGFARVTAIDTYGSSLAALTFAGRHARGLKPITALVRDLARDPLSATELRDFDAVIFDPPHAGARAQARSLAQSKVPTLVAISCNPATLARDLRDLIDGGYRLESIMPVDQFLYSTELEAIAVLRR